MFKNLLHRTCCSQGNPDAPKKQGLYPPPLILVGLRRTPADSDGLRRTPTDSGGLRRTPPESGEFGGSQIRRETVLPKYFSHTFQHQITPEYQRNITVLPPDSHRNLMKT